MNPALVERLDGEPDDAYDAFRRYVHHHGQRSRVAAELDVDRDTLRCWATQWRWRRRYRYLREHLDRIAEQYRNSSMHVATVREAATSTLAMFAAEQLRASLEDGLWEQYDVATELGWPIETVGTSAFTTPTLDADLARLPTRKRRPGRPRGS